MLEITLVLASAAMTVVTSAKCRNSIDQGVRWTIDCSAMDLSEAPPPSILHPVVTLNVSNNLFVHLTPSQFSNWTDILHLDLSANRITIVDLDTFKGLINLTELNLMNNYIETLSPNITNNLTKLRILNLSNNKIKEIHMGSFETVPILLKLYLNNNSDLGKATRNYNNLNVALEQGLLSLDLSNISLSEIEGSFFTNASRLISLNLAQNPLKNIPLLAPSLRNLNISGISIETFPQDLFSRSDLLEKLYIQGMPLLRDIKSRSFNGLVHLEDLVIKDCPKLRFISEDTFGESSPKLQRLVISDCAISTLPKTFAPLLDRVVCLDLQNNPWYCDGRITWITSARISSNLTTNLRCDQPPAARGQRLHDFFQPRSLHAHFTMVQAGVVLLIVATFVASIVGVVRQMSKQKVKMYRQLQDIALQERTPANPSQSHPL